MNGVWMKPFIYGCRQASADPFLQTSFEYRNFILFRHDTFGLWNNQIILKFIPSQVWHAWRAPPKRHVCCITPTSIMEWSALPFQAVCKTASHAAFSVAYMCMYFVLWGTVCTCTGEAISWHDRCMCLCSTKDQLLLAALSVETR